MSRTSIKAALAIAGAATAPAACASSVQAATSGSLTYKCKFPLVGTQPVKLDLTLDIPDRWPVGEPTAPFAVTAKLSIDGTFAQGLELVEGLSVLGGVREAQKPGKGTAARMRVELPDGSGVNVRVPIDIEPYEIVPPIPDPLVLSASGTTPSLTLDVPGQAKLVLTELILNLYGHYEDGTPVEGLTTPPTDVDRLPYADIDGDPATFNVPCKLDPAGQNLQLPTPWPDPDPDPDPDVSPPSKPGLPVEGDYAPTDFTSSSINVKWRPSADDRGIVSYKIDYEGGPASGVIVPAGSNTGVLSKLITGLGADSEYIFAITAIDAAGNESDALEQTHSTPPVPPDTIAPSNPVVSGRALLTSATLTWTASTDNVGVAGYDVYLGSSTTPVASTTELTATITGLSEDTSYAFRVVARDAAGNRSSGSTLNLRTLHGDPPDPGTASFGYALKGTTSLRTLTKGTLNLSGGIAAKLTLTTGAVAADLTLADTSGRLVAAGFLPVTAKIGFVPSGKTTGTFIDGVLKTNSKVRIKVNEVKLFGAIPLAGGNTCQTRSLSEINLQSTQPEFKPLAGGPLAGTYKISDLNGCGPLNGLVSPLTAGGGNTITINLTPATAGASPR